MNEGKRERSDQDYEDVEALEITVQNGFWEGVEIVDALGDLEGHVEFERVFQFLLAEQLKESAP